MTVDVHAHFWTDDYLDQVAALGKTDTAAQRGRGAGDGAELDARLALMDRAGVGMQVLSGLAPGEAHRVLAANAQALLGLDDETGIGPAPERA